MVVYSATDSIPYPKSMDRDPLDHLSTFEHGWVDWEGGLWPAMHTRSAKAGAGAGAGPLGLVVRTR